MNKKRYSETELDKQGQVITRVLETGTPEEIAILHKAFADPDLHPQIK